MQNTKVINHTKKAYDIVMSQNTLQLRGIPNIQVKEILVNLFREDPGIILKWVKGKAKKIREDVMIPKGTGKAKNINFLATT